MSSCLAEDQGFYLHETAVWPFVFLWYSETCMKATTLGPKKKVVLKEVVS